MSPRPNVQESRQRRRQRILDLFEERARNDGPRAVVMAELARDLGISTRTLYQHFGSKAELLQEMMDRWAAEVASLRESAQQRGGAVQERLLRAAQVWIAAQDRFSVRFWSQVRRDHPEAARVIDGQLGASLATIGRYLRPRIHGDLDPGLSLSLLRGFVRRALDPEHCDELGLARADAVGQAIDVWCRGALRGAADPAEPGPGPGAV